MKYYLLIFHYSSISFMSAGYSARTIEAESPQQAVDSLVSSEGRDGYAISNIKVYAEIEPPDGKWEASDEP